VTPGTYTLTGAMTGYTTWTQSKTLNSGDALTGQNVAMVPVAVVNASISGGVRDANTSAAIGGATVTLVQNGTAAYTTTSGSNGTYSFSNVTPGTYTLTGAMTGYTTWTQSKTLNSGDALTGQNIAMVPVAVVNASISGGVRDANTSVAIGGATVTLVQNGTAAYTTTSASNGTYSISSVIPGIYILTGVMSGYNTWTQSKTLNTGDALTGQNIAFTSVLPKNKVLGIDISSNNGIITQSYWRQMKANGITFAFVRSSQGNAPDYDDAKFGPNIDSGSSAGIIMGPYHVGYPNLNANADVEAQYFIGKAKSYIKHGALPPALDIEGAAKALDPLVLSAWIQEWVSYVKQQTGIEPILYCDQSTAQKLCTYLYNKVKLWIAAPGDPIAQPDNAIWGQPDNTHWEKWPWLIQQYTQPAPAQPTINGMDQDVFNGTIDQFNAFIQIPTYMLASHLSSDIPQLRIYQNDRNGYPTALCYIIPKDGPVNVTIYNINGRCLQELSLEKQKGGMHVIDLKQSGQFTSSGFYLAKIVSDNKSAMGTILFEKR
jgi:Lyzozyme M1 (1,4-beta-N-acetylmuramidase)